MKCSQKREGDKMDSPKVKRIAKIPEWLKELKLQKAGIGIYCRVSTSEQRQLRSLSNQITSLIKTVQGWDCLPYLKDVYVDIEKHPAFRQEHCDRNERHK